MPRSWITIATFLITTQGFAADTPPPEKPWNSTAGAGLAVTSGNTDTKSYNLSLATKYDPKTKFIFKADALYLRGESNGTTQVDKAGADARGDYSLSEKVFAFGEVTYLRDPFKDLNYFIAPVAGAGYRIIKTDIRSLTVDGAVGAVMESGRIAGRSSSGAIKGGENFEWALSPTSKVTQKLTGIWKTNEFSDALYHFDAGLTATVASHAEMKFAYVYDYKNKTPSASVKKGDSALFAALLFKF